MKVRKRRSPEAQVRPGEEVANTSNAGSVGEHLPATTATQRILTLDCWERSGLTAEDFAPLVSVSKASLYAWRAAFKEDGPAGLEPGKRGAPRPGPVPPPDQDRRGGGEVHGNRQPERADQADAGDDHESGDEGAGGGTERVDEAVVPDDRQAASPWRPHPRTSSGNSAPRTSVGPSMASAESRKPATTRCAPFSPIRPMTATSIAVAPRSTKTIRGASSPSSATPAT